jgi:hypothetical protein
LGKDMLLMRRKEKLFKQNAIMDNIAHSLVCRKMNFLLLIMSKNDSLSCLDSPRIHRLFTDKHTHKSRLTYSIFSDNTYTFMMSKFMRKICQ